MRTEHRSISVVIPVWNDAVPLRDALHAVQTGGRAAPEIIVVDGGSTDESACVAHNAGVRVVASPVRQRAMQMNLGAQQATGDVLLFLHADTLLPAEWESRLQHAFQEDAALVGGAFRRRFVPGSFWLRLTCRLADARGRWLGWFLGDQAMFVRRTVFEQLGGFTPLRACEDIDFSLRLARVGRTVLLRAVVRSSDRRFHARGGVHQTLVDFATVVRYWIRRETFLLPTVGGER